MKLFFIVFGSLFGFMLFLLVANYIHYANYGNETEVAIEAVAEDNKNILAQYGQKLAEAGQVPDMYVEDFTKITKAAIEGRYGANGSQAVFQFLKEQNPQIDASLYKQLQQIVESGRNDFKAGQTKLIDVRRQYKAQLGNVWSGFWLKLAGYPKMDLKTDFLPISTDRANKAFESGAEEPIKLRN